MKHAVVISAMLSWGSLAMVSGQVPVAPPRYLEYPSAMPNQILKATKVLDPQTGQVRIRVSQNGADVPASVTALEAAEASQKRAMNGPLGDEVADEMATATRADKFRVSVHLKYPPITYPNKTLVSAEEAAAASRAAAQVQPVTSLQNLFQRHGLMGLATRGNDAAEGTLTWDQLQDLKLDRDVASIEILHDEKLASPEITTLDPSAYNPGPVPSGSGSGVRAATFEQGLTASFLSCIGVTPALWDANISQDSWEIRHANTVFRALIGAAPSATYYHRRTYTFDGTDDVNYIVNNNIQTLSLSATRGATTPYHSTYSEFLTMDDFAYRSPYPVFVDPSANDGYVYEVNWQPYNAISVGNVRHTNNATYEMVECMQAKNPPPVYGGCIAGSGSGCAGDREMPYILVPGAPYTGTDFAATCVGGGGTISCATSWSAGVGNGIAADVIAADSRMISWPEKVRAVLLLTAQNVDGAYWSSNTDGRDGAGVVSGSAAVAFAQGHTSVSPGNTAVEKGMGSGSIYAADFSAPNKRFYYAVPNPKPAGKHLRVVLTWDSNPIVGGGTNALSDMDLIVQNDGGTQGSYSWDSNVEMVDVAASSVTAGSSYYIDVDPAINRIPASGSRTNFFYYAIAWAWVKDHAD